MESKNKHGGARPGAGRPKGAPYKKMTFQVPLDIVEALENVPNKNRFLAEALRAHITAERNQN